VRTVFLGTSEFAAAVLRRFADSPHRPVLVVTRPDRPRGRGRRISAPPVALAARELGIELDQPDSINHEDARTRIAEAKPDAVCVCAFGALIKVPLLSEHRMLNVHPSLLPRWRGAAPINRAIMAGDAESGVSVMRTDEGLDTGPVALMEQVAIAPNVTAGDLHDRLAIVGADLMARALAALERGSLAFRPQSEEGATYAKKIDNAETRIDWSKPAAAVHNLIRGLSTFPGAWFELGGMRVKALRSERADWSGKPGTTLDDGLMVACGNGAVRLLEVQRAGAKPMKAEDFLRGTPVAAGTALS
jgi:methionyl-tRNA formyltransferase